MEVTPLSSSVGILEFFNKQLLIELLYLFDKDSVLQCQLHVQIELNIVIYFGTKF